MLANILNNGSASNPSQSSTAGINLLASPLQPSPSSSSRPTSQSTKSASPSKSPYKSISGLSTATPLISPNKAAIGFISNQDSVPGPSHLSTRPSTPGSSALARPIDLSRMVGSDVDTDDVEMDEATAALEGEDLEEVEDDGQEFEDAEEGEGEGEGEGEDEDEDDEEDEEDDEDDESEDDDDDKSEDLEAAEDVEEFEVTEVKLSEGGADGTTVVVKSEPGTTTEAELHPDGITAEELPVNTLIPKKKKAKKRAASLDDVPLAPPPMKTIRLERRLVPGPDAATMEWNVLEDAREQGMVEDWAPVDEKDEGMEVNGPASAPPERVDGEVPNPPMDGVPGLFGLGGLDEDPEEVARRLEEKYGDADKKKPKKIKRKNPEAVYDLEDPFIDDSELIIDAPTHFGRAKKEGFYVHAGPLELMEEEIKARPRTQARKPKTGTSNAVAPRPTLSALTAAKSAAQGHGTKNSPIAIDADDDQESKPQAGPSRVSQDATRSPSPPESLAPVAIDRALYKNASREPAYLPPFPTFPRGIRHALMALRTASNGHGWNAAEKAKFPESLKPLLKRAGRSAFEYDMFGTREEAKGFYQALTSVLPYNLFTLTKLVQRLCYSDYWDFLHECEKTGIEALSELVDGEKNLMIRRYEEAMETWKSEIAEWQAKNPLNTQAATVTQAPDSQVNENGEEEPAASSNGPPREPAKRFTWTPPMREVFTQLLDNHQEILNFNAAAAEKNIPNVYTGKDYTERALKQELYTKVVNCFPDGYMSNADVSKEMSKIRARDKKQQKSMVEG